MLQRSLAIVAAGAFAAALPAQNVITSFPLVTANGTPVGLDAAPGGDLYFTDLGANDEIGTINLGGTILTSAAVTANSGNPIGITSDASGNIYVTDTIGQDVDVYDSGFNFLNSFPVGLQTTFPEGIAWSSVTNNLYVVDGTAANVFEYDLAGNLITTFPINGSSVDGIAHDAAGDTFWIYDSGTDSVRQYDNMFMEIRSFPGTNANGFGFGEGLALLNNIVYVCVTGVDTVVAFGTRNPSLVGTAEATLNSTMLDGDALTPFEDNWFIRFDAIDTTSGNVNTGLPFICFLNFGTGAPPAQGTTALIPGFVQTWAASMPAGPTLTIAPPAVVGGGTPFIFQASSGIFAPGDELRLQGLMVDPTLPGRIFDKILVSNTISFRHRNPVTILIRAEGTNSFNTDTSRGFFSVENVAAPDIIDIVFDWSTSSNPNQATMVFDTDQTGMADRFDGGNSTLASCLGTYRNGSDAATGLVYDAMNNPTAACDPAANTGWIGTGGTGTSVTTLQFRFAPGTFLPGQKFETDIDTDGGQGISGDNMDGMVVTVTLNGGTTFTGELRTAGPNLAELTF